MANFTNNKINKTFQRLVQVDNKTLQDGLGNLLSGSMGTLAVSGGLAITGSLGITGFNDVSSSLSNLETFSSSLNATFATDAELEAVSSSLSTRIDGLNISGINAATSSYALKVDISGSFNVVSSSLATRVASQEDFSSSLNATFATDAEVSTAVSSLNAATSSYALAASTGSYALKNQISGSFNIVSSSLASRVASQETFSSSLDATFATDAQVSTAVSALNAATSSYALASTSALKSEISGSFNLVSSSIATDISASNVNITDNTGNINSLTALTSSYAVHNQDNEFTANQSIRGSLIASSSKIGSHHWGGQLFSTKAEFNDFNMEQNRNSSDGTDFSFFKSRGTPGSEMYAQAGDEIFNLRAFAYKSGSTNTGTGLQFSDYEFVSAITTDVVEVRPQSSSGNIMFTTRDITRQLHNVTIDSYGHISSSSDISASNFYGDGSTLNFSDLVKITPSATLPTSNITTGSVALSGSGADLSLYVFAGTGSFGPGYLKITGNLS